MKLTTLFLTLFAFTSLIQAQSIEREVIGAFGSSNEQLSSTIGEPVTGTISNNNNTLTQGFHQGEYTITQISEIPANNISISLYPNPAINYVTIRSNTKDLNYELIDGNGKIVKKGEITSNEFTLNLINCDESNYFIRIFDENQNYFKNYKLIKY